MICRVKLEKMFDKILAFLEIVINIIRSIASSLPFILAAIGLFTMLLGATLNVGGIFVLGFFLLAIGVLIYLIGLLRR